MIAWNRIDSRLIHGQVIEAWLPHLGVSRVVVADDEASKDPLARAAYGLAVPPEVEVVMGSPNAIDFPALARDSVRTLILFRDVKSAVAARAHGLPNGPLNVGNVHAGPGRVSISRSVFLDESDSAALGELARSGMEVRVQAVPSEKAMPLS
ncbi:MAG: PTS sugar transporter subunit IIB [Archangium sp.]|nr:PTS sugar transporter subunit IIB [Archangium sp.]